MSNFSVVLKHVQFWVSCERSNECHALIIPVYSHYRCSECLTLLPHAPLAVPNNSSSMGCSCVSWESHPHWVHNQKNTATPMADPSSCWEIVLPAYFTWSFLLLLTQFHSFCISWFFSLLHHFIYTLVSYQHGPHPPSFVPKEMMLYGYSYLIPGVWTAHCSLPYTISPLNFYLYEAFTDSNH